MTEYRVGRPVYMLGPTVETKDGRFMVVCRGMKDAKHLAFMLNALAAEGEWEVRIAPSARPADERATA